MRKFTTQSNQWSIGIGLRHSSIYDSFRWIFWINHGFLSTSWSWKRNPKAPHVKEQHA